MTPRFRLALVALLALAAVTAVVWLLRGSSTGPGPSEAPARSEASRPDPASLDGPDLEGSGGTGPGAGPDGGTGGGRAGGGTGGLQPGLRRPSGLDLSNPEARRKHLLELLATPPIAWDDVAAVVGITTEPLDPAVKAALLQAVRGGDRNGASKCLAVAHDPTLVPDLLQILDDPASAVGARRVAMLALSQMPGADAAEVVKQLESRLKGPGAGDGEVLGAIARRGGAEAARAVTEYLARSPDAARLVQGVAGQLDLVRDPAAAAVVADAFAATKDPAALSALVFLASARPGAVGLTAPLIALDRDDVPEALRTQALEALAQVGSEEGTEHLLRVARQPGAFGERAQLALGNLRSASPKAREALVAELERSQLNPRAELARSTLLEALGTLRERKALPAVVQSLRDSSDRVRNSAVRALGRMRDLSRPHVAEIGALWSDGSPATRTALAVSLGSIGGPEAAQLLETWAQDTSAGPDLRRTLGHAASQARGEPTPEEEQAADRR